MEASKNDAQVLIDGKVLTLSGFESEEYLQKVAAYLNGKIAECQKIRGFNRQTIELRNIMISLNIADDYFKARSAGAVLEREIDEREKENYDLKHDLIACRMDLEKVQEEKENLKNEITELQKKLIKLEAELEKKEENVTD